MDASHLWVFVVFFLSGAAALIYQLVWQRLLFTIYGIDIASVTVVVTAFMLGLGLGSVLGGVLLERRPGAALLLFAAFELGIGAFGAISPGIFRLVASFTAGIGHAATAVVAFVLVVFPTTLMGATLPLLVGYLTRRSGNVGKSLSSLYFVNTVGAAAGAFAAVIVVLGQLGLSGSVRSAAVLNVVLGIAVFILARFDEPQA